ALGVVLSDIAEFQVEGDSDTEPSICVDWDRFPFHEMYRQNWFIGFSGDLPAARRNRVSLLESFFSHSHVTPSLTLLKQRVRSRGHADAYALLAWQCRVLFLAQQKTIGTYRPGAINEAWARELVRLSKYQDGPKRAKAMLEDVGLSFIVLPHLSRTYL